MHTDLDIGVAAPKRVLLFLAAGALVAGLCLSVVGALGLGWASDDAKWRETSAEVLSVASEPRPYQCEGARPRACLGTQISVSYAWTVDGTRYRGNRYSQDEVVGLWGEDSNDEASAFEARLRAEKRVPAFVNPDDPSEAILFRREAAPALVASGMGSFLLTVGLTLLVVYLVRRRSYRRALAAFAALD